MNILLLFLELTSVLIITESSNILMVLPLGSRSHKNIFVPLAEKLANHSHKVTLLSMYGPEGNVTLPYEDIMVSAALATIQNLSEEFDVFKLLNNSRGKNINAEIMKMVVKNLPEYCEAFLRDPAVQKIWDRKPDLILLPAFINECGLILVQKFKVPFIYVTTSGLTPWTADLVGNPEHPAYVPNQYLPFSDDMTFGERIINCVFRLLTPALRRRFILDRLDKVAHKYLNDTTVSLQEVEKNVSLVLVNSHHSLGFPRPLQPNVIEVGGMHCREAGTIADPELKEFLDSSKDRSVILFSLGSQIKSSQMPLPFKSLLVSVFSKLPYKVIWKWEGPHIHDLPTNILLRPWLPQQDVLGHRAVGAFFTHGGLLSSQEAVYHGVPMIGLPLMSDQHLNVKQAEAAGFALCLKLETLTEEELEKTLKRIIEDKSFGENARKRSLVMKDQETKPVDRATYYTEFVIRHNGAINLRSFAASMSFMQLSLADVILTASLTSVAAVAIVISFIALINIVCRRCFLVIIRGIVSLFVKRSNSH